VGAPPGELLDDVDVVMVLAGGEGAAGVVPCCESFAATAGGWVAAELDRASGAESIGGPFAAGAAA
jgi:hypothetical protein